MLRRHVSGRAFTNRRNPRKITTANHPSTSSNQVTREILDPHTHRIVTTEKYRISNDPHRRAKRTNEKPPRKAIGKIPSDTIDERTPEENGNAEILTLLYGHVKPKAQDDWQEDAEAIEDCQAHDLYHGMEPGFDVFDGHHEFVPGVVAGAAGVGFCFFGSATHDGFVF